MKLKHGSLRQSGTVERRHIERFHREAITQWNRGTVEQRHGELRYGKTVAQRNSDTAQQWNSEPCHSGQLAQWNSGLVAWRQNDIVKQGTVELRLSGTKNS